MTQKKTIAPVNGDGCAASCSNDGAESLYKGLHTRDAIISAINFLSTHYVCHASWDAEIEVLLKRLGEALDVSRVYIFRNGKNTSGEITMTHIHEWAAEGIDAEIANPDLREVTYREAGAQRWLEEMQQGREIAGFVRDLPVSEQEALGAQSILSILAVPIYVSGEWWGFIGFDHCLVEHDWNNAEINLLRSAANTIGSALLRQRIEDALRASEENERKFRMLSEQSLVGIGIVQNEEIIYANGALCGLLEACPGDLIAGNPMLSDCVVPEDLPALQVMLSRCTAENSTGNHITIRIVSKNTAETWVNMYIRKITFQNHPAHLLTMVDISSQKQTEEALRQSESRYRLVAENVRDVIWAFDRAFNYTYISPSVYSLTGYTTDEAFAMPPDRLMVGESFEVFRAVFTKELNAGKRTISITDAPHVMELELLHKDGYSVWTETSFAPLLDEDAALVGMMAVSRDISRRKEVQNELVDTIERLRLSLEGTITAIARTVEIRDPYTAGHQNRVAELALAIAKYMELDPDTMDGISMAGVIHDIGKISVPAEILSKPGHITAIEFGLIKNHPDVGYQILKDIIFPWPVAEIVLQHHERLDGSGYPRGLKGDQILLEARILAVADVVEAMASHRPYRPALGIEKALEEISMNASILYDKNVVAACMRIFKDNVFAFSD